jgi:hypothetical protein
MMLTHVRVHKPNTTRGRSWTRFTRDPALHIGALLECSGINDCTVVSVDESNGHVQLCRTTHPNGWSSYPARLERSSEDFTTYIWKGHDSGSNSTRPSPLTAAFLPKPPDDWRDPPRLPTCGACPSDKHLVFGCGVTHRHVCHECATGACPVVPGDVHPILTRVLLNEATNIPLPEHGVPCVVPTLFANGVWWPTIFGTRPCLLLQEFLLLLFAL